MTDFASLLQPDRGQPAVSLQLVTKNGFDAWLASRPERARVAVAAQGFKGAADSLAILPGDGPADWSAALGVDAGEPAPWSLAKAAGALPAGAYRLADTAPGQAALGWLLAQHRFARYRENKAAGGPRVMLSGAPAEVHRAVMLAEVTALVRDLVDTPASDLGPAELAAAALEQARALGAEAEETRGEALERGFPMIHAVGRAAGPGREPRLVELRWGNPAHARVAVVGKGVCFDSGGLNIKPASGMRHMKKDMGGAAHALALARLVIGARLPVRLHVLLPIVENAINGNAFRPGDVLRSRAGRTVEIGNTDAEGRLILADALTKAGEESPELLLDFATLTGAARVALGPDLPPLFSNDEALAADLLAAAERETDPLWRMPLWAPYADMLKSEVADFASAGDGSFAGAITAALFLQRFVADATSWAHLDIFAWRQSAKPGRPAGGEALGLRAAFAMLEARYAA